MMHGLDSGEIVTGGKLMELTERLEEPTHIEHEANKPSGQGSLAAHPGTNSSPGSDAASCNLVVDIYDQMYHLRGPDPKYLQQLSALVDAKMRAVAQHGTTVDSLRVAVLAALNIADELVTLQQQREALDGNVVDNIKSRTEVLAEMLDAALDANRKAG
jgi:cell division protein ZapA